MVKFLSKKMADEDTSVKEEILGFLATEIISSIIILGDDAYGVPIGKMVEKNYKKCTVGAIYETLHRLESKSYLEARDTEPEIYRGGRKKRIYKVTASGRRVLNNTRRYQANILANRQNIIEEGQLCPST